ncbi:MAG TPA: DNA polymerase IV [Rhizomicrobium sp.]|jgi:DNA polymerase-4|nr:DNA polymerase IV [Rhizomicrobium sp.]
MAMCDWPALCRDCLSDISRTPQSYANSSGESDVSFEGACLFCGSTRVLAHPELDRLAIAHLDCDAFYAAIEQRDDPSLRGRPLIVGGGVRGVVATACYFARKSGVRSAMPMFQARKLCPEAVVVKPRMAVYAGVARQVREMMQALTPLVEPLSLDEAYLDLSGTERIHGTSPAGTMAKLALAIEREIGITVSVGLSGNKFLAKLASELDKPRGFAVIGLAEAKSFLRDKPVGLIRGAGKVLAARLARDGFCTIGQLQDADPRDLAARYGATGMWLSRMAHADDTRPVDPGGEMKTISSETTFDNDLWQFADLEAVLWRQAERVSARAKAKALAGHTITLKLKTARFQLRTRSSSLDAPTQLADRIFRMARVSLKREADGTRFRLLGVGLANLVPAAGADPVDLIDAGADKRAAAERAMDRIRAKWGGEAVATGRGLRK